MSCAGRAAEWSIEIGVEGATFNYIGTTAMDIPQMSRAEGRAWLLAMTLISADYSSTAILIVEPRTCETGTHAAHVLTQRNETPVLLVGCCNLQD